MNVYTRSKNCKISNPISINKCIDKYKVRIPFDLGFKVCASFFAIDQSLILLHSKTLIHACELKEDTHARTVTIDLTVKVLFDFTIVE